MIQMKSIMIILVIIGIILLIIDITKRYYTCPLNKIEYRYIPRTFEEESKEPVPLNDIFDSMFKNPSINSK